MFCWTTYPVYSVNQSSDHFPDGSDGKESACNARDRSSIPIINYPFVKDIHICLGFPGGLVVNNPPANAGHWGSFPWSRISPREGNGNPLQESCWRAQWTEEPVGLQSMGCKNVRQDLTIKQQQHLHLLGNLHL